LDKNYEYCPKCDEELIEKFIKEVQEHENI